MITEILTNVKTLKGLTEEELETVMNELTVDNPAYLSAVRFSRGRDIKIPKYLFYFNAHPDNSISVPLGYAPSLHISSTVDLREESTCNYPPFRFNLRETQIEAYNSYIEDTDKGLICLPTGKGKTVLGLYIASRLKQRTLVIVHKDDLLTGWQKDCEKCLGIETGIIKAKKRKLGEQITIATIQTLVKLSPEEVDNLSKYFGAVIVDECHHAPSNSYEILAKLNCPYKIGLTATPERSDGLTQVMHFYLGDFAYVCEIDKDDEDILPVEVIVKDSRAEFTPMLKEYKSNGRTRYKVDPKGRVPITSIPYDERPRISYQECMTQAFSCISYRETLLNDVLKEYREGHSCLILVSLKEHLRAINDLLLEEVPEEDLILYYGDSKNNSEGLEKAESKRATITIATYGKATEGTNCKQWEVLFLASSIKDGKNVEQAVGRIRRRTDKPKLSVARVYDYRFDSVYQLSNHGKERDLRYKKLNFHIIRSNQKSRETRPLFQRGYRK